MCLCRQKDACGANGRGYAVHAPSANAGNVSIFYSQGAGTVSYSVPPHSNKRAPGASRARCSKKLLTMP